MRLAFANGKVSAAGTLFGKDPVTVPLALPPPDAAPDGKAEIDLLVSAGEDLAARLVEQRAIGWLQRELR